MPNIHYIPRNQNDLPNNMRAELNFISEELETLTEAGVKTTYFFLFYRAYIKKDPKAKAILDIYKTLKDIEDITQRMNRREPIDKDVMKIYQRALRTLNNFNLPKSIKAKSGCLKIYLKAITQLTKTSTRPKHIKYLFGDNISNRNARGISHFTNKVSIQFENALARLKANFSTFEANFSSIWNNTAQNNPLEKTFVNLF